MHPGEWLRHPARWLLAPTCDDNQRLSPRQVHVSDTMYKVSSRGAHLLATNTQHGATAEDGEVFRFGPYRLLPSNRALLLGERQLELGSRAFDILVMLVRAHGAVISRKEILSKVWPDVVVDETNLRAQIAQLRHVLQQDADTDTYISNVRGRGYVFIAPVERIAATPAPPTPAIRPTRWRLPGRLHRLIGRQETLTLLSSQLREHRFIAIVGPGGVGKTTAAIELGHRVAADFDNDVCYVDLGSLSAADQVLPTVALSLGYPVQSGDLLAGLASFLADRNMLLILDCCERVIDAVSELSATLFSHAPRVHLLATSRETLRAEGEVVHLLEPLQVPSDKPSLTAVEALTAPSVQLFMQRATASGYIGDLADKDASAVAAICRQLDGIPLAIELAGSRVITYGFSGLLEVLRGRSILTWPGRRHEPRHRTLEATLDWSFQLLSDGERRVLARLSVFVGAFTMQAAQAVASDEFDDRWAVARAIENLADKSLIAIRAVGGTHQYRLLDVTRYYAELKLSESGEQATLARKHAQYCCDLLAEHSSNCRRRATTRTAPAIEAGNVRAALEWCFATDCNTELGITLAANAAFAFLNLSMLGECVRWSQAALTHLSEDAAPSTRALKLQEALATSLMYTSGNDERVGTAIQQGLQLAAQLGARDSELHLLAGYNLFLTRREHLLQALDCAERFATMARSSGDPVERAVSEWMLGAAHRLIGRERLGQDYLERGFAIADANGIDKVYYFGYEHRGRADIGRAQTAWLCGTPDKARRHSKRVIDAAVAENHPVSLCIVYLYTLPVVVWLRDFEWAEQLSEALISLAAKYLLKPYLSGGLAVKGELLIARGDIEAGVRLLRDALDSLRAVQLNIVYTNALRAYTEGLARLGRSDEAKQLIATAIAHARNGYPTTMLPELMRTQGDILVADADPDAAQACYLRAMSLARDNGALGWELRSALCLAQLWINQGQREAAQDLLETTLAKFSEGFGTGDLLTAQQLIETAAFRPHYRSA